MYSDEILSQLNKLSYLRTIKGSTITATSKKNNFNDIVKFYAMINKEDVIEKISYKATGCTHFVVYCNYFCGLVEGKTIKSALKVNAETFEQFGELRESRKHIIDIIIATFALLVKKYRKGVENGSLVPVGGVANNKTDSKKTVENSKTKTESTKVDNKSSKTTNPITTSKINKNTEESSDALAKQHSQKANNVNTLKAMVDSSKKVHTKKEDPTQKQHSRALTDMIYKMNHTDKETEAIDNSIDNLKMLDNKRQMKAQDSAENSETQTKKQKKGLFSWLRK